jgi:hypothetical protein
MRYVFLAACRWFPPGAGAYAGTDYGGTRTDRGLATMPLITSGLQATQRSTVPTARPRKRGNAPARQRSRLSEMVVACLA